MPIFHETRARNFRSLMEPVLVGILVVLQEDFNLVVHLVSDILAADAGYTVLVNVKRMNGVDDDLPMMPTMPNDSDERQVVRRPTT